MINGPVAALQLILIIASLVIVLYALLIKGDENRTTCVMFLINLCLLWMVLI